MPSTVETPEGYEVVPGRSQKKALTLLRIAEELGHDASVVSVRPRSDEYTVPKDVADKFRESGEDEIDVDANKVAPSRDGSASRWVPNEDIEEKRKAADSVSEDEIDETDDEDKAPAKNASKAEWVEFAKSKGYNESEDLTKDALIEKYGDA